MVGVSSSTGTGGGAGAAIDSGLGACTGFGGEGGLPRRAITSQKSRHADEARGSTNRAICAQDLVPPGTAFFAGAVAGFDDAPHPFSAADA